MVFDAPGPRAPIADLLAWTHLPNAINHWDDPDGIGQFDCQPWPAIFSGSTTMVGDDPHIFYSVPCQTWVNGAVPANRSDPLLVEWKKQGPIFNATQSVTNGSGIDVNNRDWGTTFRDPTSAWQVEPDGTWFAAFACMNGTCLFESDDFQTWRSSETGDGWFHFVNKSGTWECPDVLKMPGTEGTYVLKANTAQVRRKRTDWLTD